MSILPVNAVKESCNVAARRFSADPELEERALNLSEGEYEEKLSIMCIPWTVEAVFCGTDYDDVLDRQHKARKIINRFENDIDAYIAQKRSELSAELCLICEQLEIE